MAASLTVLIGLLIPALGLNVESDSNGFSIYFADLPLISHSLTEPLVAVGASRSNFTEIAGNFLIEDEVLELTELPDFTADVSGLPGQFSAVLSSNANPGVSVRLVVSETVSEHFTASIRLEVQVNGRDRLWFRLQSAADEKIYGGGEQFTYLNLKGRDFPIWTREQ